jgi:hypothetical protein
MLAMMHLVMGASSMLREFDCNDLCFLPGLQDQAGPISVLTFNPIHYKRYLQYPVIGPKSYGPICITGL